ncbi:molybdate ABC transporter substrate-binding protein [Mycobacterium cookii]|uniref:Molybdate ABC transporter substrate-binding protein n=1 Tax=Nocardioides furvisabuli TaxID=375542 RepID=A0ABP5J209_9ACTN|nr:molybdate ABC transporter substrate-binding protein [Nocardioides furvisabuli]
MRRTALAGLLLLVPLAACSGDGDDGEQTLTVLAAASLTETFTELAATFEDEHPGVEVELVFGSSTTLAEQAADGAPGRVLATADEVSMGVADDAGVLATAPEPFVGNTLTVVTPPDNPAGITSLDDLDAPGVDYVVCASTAPCGAAAEELLDSAGIEAPPASEEVDVKAVLARVVQGEADAGLVYRTDAVAAGDDVAEVAIPDADDVTTTYVVAPLSGAAGASADLAAEFVALVRSEEARAVFTRAGFGEVASP